MRNLHRNRVGFPDFGCPFIKKGERVITYVFNFLLILSEIEMAATYAAAIDYQLFPSNQIILPQFFELIPEVDCLFAG